jgi:hypothetical protein
MESGRWKREPKGLKPTYVYVMTAGEHVKIGLAEDVERRRLTLQGSNPLAVSVAATMLFKNFAVARSVERQLHAAFAEQRGYGEWFTVPEATAALALMDYADMAFHLPEPPKAAPIERKPYSRAPEDRKTWDEMEAMTSDEWVEYMRPVANTLQF